MSSKKSVLSFIVCVAMLASISLFSRRVEETLGISYIRKAFRERPALLAAADKGDKCSRYNTMGGKPLCSKEVFRCYFKQHDYYPGNGSWTSVNHTDPKNAFEPDLCRFRENIMSKKRLGVCVKKLMPENIVILGSSNGRNYFMSFLHYIRQALGTQCRITKMENYYNESDMQDGVVHPLSNDNLGALHHATNYFRFRDLATSQHLVAETDAIFRDFRKGFKRGQFKRNKRFMTKREYYSDGDGHLYSRLKTKRVYWMNGQKRIYWMYGFASVQVVCPYPSGAAARRGTPKEMTLEFIPTMQLGLDSLTLSPSKNSNATSTNATVAIDGASNFDEFIFKHYLRGRKRMTAFAFFPGKHLKFQSRRAEPLLRSYVSYMKDYLSPTTNFFLIPDFGEREEVKSKNTLFGAVSLIDGQLPSQLIEKYNHYLFDDAKDMYRQEENGYYGFFDIFRLGKSVKHWNWDGAHFVSRWYQLMVSYLLQTLCESTAQ